MTNGKYEATIVYKVRDNGQGSFVENYEDVESMDITDSGALFLHTKQLGGEHDGKVKMILLVNSDQWSKAYLDLQVVEEAAS